jgi:protein-S-isoprenylcysteine O-methyltransferase Ste14
VNGIPSVGQFVMVGNGVLGRQPMNLASVLPPSTSLVTATVTASGGAIVTSTSASTAAASATGSARSEGERIVAGGMWAMLGIVVLGMM